MGQISNTGLEAWVVRRLLGFFNRAAIAADISASILKDDPATGQGRFVIGDVVAQRIIDKRNALPGMRFTELRQLDGIRGLGADKIHDLIYTLSVPAAEAFRVSMYHHVLRESWILEHHSVRFEDEEQFLHVVSDSKVFLEWIEGQAAIIARDRTRDNRLHAEVRRRLRAAPLEVYEHGDVAAHAFALWFYRITADSWFNYEQVQRETATFLDFMPDFLDRTDLRMFEGFRNQGLLAGPITGTGLPVTVNYSEQVISIWTVQVID